MTKVYLVFGEDEDTRRGNTHGSDIFDTPVFEKAFGTRESAEEFVQKVTDREKFPTLWYFVQEEVVYD